MTETRRRNPLSTAALALVALTGLYSLGILVKTIIFWASAEGEFRFKALNPVWLAEQIGDNGDAYATWLLQAAPVLAVVVGVLIGAFALIGLLRHSAGAAGVAWGLSVVLVLAFVVAEILGIVLISNAGSVGELLFEPQEGPYGLWATLVVILLALALVLAALSRTISPSSSPAATATAPVTSAATPTYEPQPSPATSSHEPQPTAVQSAAPAGTGRSFADIDGRFFLQVEGVEYGPYDARQIADFADEGRVIPSSLIRPEHGFYEEAARAPGLFT